MLFENYKKLMFMAGASMVWGEGVTANLGHIDVALVSKVLSVGAPSNEDSGLMVVLEFVEGGFCDYDAVCVGVLEVAANEKAGSEFQEFVFDEGSEVSIWQPVSEYF